MPTQRLNTERENLSLQTFKSGRIMRLLEYNNDSEFSLAEFFGDDTPRFDILSHRWGVEEVTLAGLTDGTGKTMAGYSKIQLCGEQAKRDGLQYF